MRLLILLFLLLLLLFSRTIFPQDLKERGLLSINEEDIRTHVEILASDSLGGRKYGQPGGRKAAEYIKNELIKIGVAPWNGDYYQPFNFHRTLYAKTGNLIFTASKAQSDTAAFFRSMDMQNVLGYIEGKNKNEIIVIGAHYDHLGTDSKLKGDTIYNGADDNASGVSAVLQIAKAFIDLGEQPKRSVIFAFFDGEEKALLGSGHFMRTFKEDSIVSQIKGFINCDMIGRGKRKHVSYFISEDKPIFREWLRNDIETYSLELKPKFKSLDQLVGISDHTTFVTYSVPIIFYHTDLHSDYHKPSDHADKIDYKKVKEIANAAFLSGWRMANTDDF